MNKVVEYPVNVGKVLFVVYCEVGPLITAIMLGGNVTIAEIAKCKGIIKDSHKVMVHMEL